MLPPDAGVYCDIRANMESTSLPFHHSATSDTEVFGAELVPTAVQVVPGEQLTDSSMVVLVLG